jgi:hypothetical protein
MRWGFHEWPKGLHNEAVVLLLKLHFYVHCKRKPMENKKLHCTFYIRVSR